MDILGEAKRVLEIESDSIRKAMDKLSENFVEAANLLFSCKGKAVVSGLGKSGLVGRKMAATLASTGTPAIFLHPAEGLHGDLGLVMRQDVAVLISNSGENDETLSLVPSLKRLEIPILAMTGNTDSSLAKYADVVLDVGVEKEACPNNLAPTASTTTLLAMGDALAVVLLKMRGFNQEDFAILHPGGSIGKRLLLTVDEIMHRNGANPLVSHQASMEQAIIEISSKGLGAVSVVDEQGILIGVITDGDLRRAIGKYHGQLLEKSVTEVMTPDCVTIESGCLAVKALNLMENRPSQISVLPVVDSSKRPLGLVRLHDLVKAGVF